MAGHTEFIILSTGFTAHQTVCFIFEIFDYVCLRENSCFKFESLAKPEKSFHWKRLISNEYLLWHLSIFENLQKSCILYTGIVSREFSTATFFVVYTHLHGPPINRLQRFRDFRDLFFIF